MAAFGAFSPFGLLEFGDVPSLAEPIYRTMAASVSKAFSVAEGTHTEANIYARALALACVRAAMRHAFNQRRPMRAVEMLPALERLYEVAPTRTQSDDSRRRAVAARKLIQRGSRPEAINNALETLLGDDFVLAYVRPIGSTVSVPTSPADVGAWDEPGYLPKFFRLLEPITSSLAWFSYESLATDGRLLAPEDRVAFEPENNMLAEAVSILGTTSSPQRALAAFTKAHNAGAIIRSHAPYWSTNRRHFIVILSASAAGDREKRERIDALMRRNVRGTTTWSIAAASSGSTIGPFTLGTSPLGSVPFGTLSFP